MRQPLFVVVYFPSEFTIDHSSDSGIRRKEFSKLTLIKTLVCEINPVKAPK